MKRFIVILVIVAIVCTSAFAADVRMGVMQNLVNTSLVVDAEFDKFGVEGAVGLPVVYFVVGGVGAIINNASGESSSSSSSGSGGFSMLGGVMANVYWKAYDGEKFDFRLGLQGDALGLVGTEGSRIFFTYGPSLGFDFKFNDKFSMNFTSAIPAAFFLQPFGDEVSKYGAYYYNDVNTEGWGVLGEVVLAIFGGIGGVGDQLARLSFKWSV